MCENCVSIQEEMDEVKQELADINDQLKDAMKNYEQAVLLLEKIKDMANS